MLVCRDLLYELVCVGDLPLPQPSPPSNKRERSESESSPYFGGSSSTTLSTNSSPSMDEPRPIAGSRRVASRYASLSSPPAAQLVVEENPLLTELPMNTFQLGQYPMYPQGAYTHEKLLPDTWDTYALMPQTTDDIMAPMQPVGDLSRQVPNMNLNYMDEAFYNQMSFIFSGSGPFGERSDQNGFGDHGMYGIMPAAAPPPPPPPLVNQMYVSSCFASPVPDRLCRAEIWRNYESSGR
jgi:hypothetical protein